MAVPSVLQRVNVATSTATLEATPTAGNLLVLIVSSSTDNWATYPSGWTLVKLGSPLTSSLAVLAKIAGASEPSSVTVEAGATVFMELVEIAGAASTVAAAFTEPLVNSREAGSVEATTETLTTPGEDLLIAAVNPQGNITTASGAVGAPWTLRTNRGRLLTADRTAGAGSYSATFTWTTSRFWTAAIFAVLPPAGKTVEGSASLTGTGLLSTTGIREALGSAPLSGAGALSATALRIAIASASLAGAGTLGASGIRAALGQSSLLGQGSLVASGESESSASEPPEVELPTTATVKGYAAAAGIGTYLSQAAATPVASNASAKSYDAKATVT